jgi:hypothetical protein
MALEIRTATGKLAFLRVHRLGSGFGPSFDFIDVEVVIGIKQVEGGFGFTLRNDNNRFTHQGMLDLLRDAFNSDAVVEVEYKLIQENSAKSMAQSFALRVGNKGHSSSGLPEHSWLLLVLAAQGV